MGFNKFYMPEIGMLETQLEKLGKDEFVKVWVKRYLKSDATIGSKESLDFIKQFILGSNEKIQEII